MQRALILAPFEPSQLDRLSKVLDTLYKSWFDTKTLQDPEELGHRLSRENVSTLVVESDFIFEETFELAPCLRFVGICRAATNQIDVCAATRSGVLVVNTPGRNAQAVAEHILGLMFALARNIPKADAYIKGMNWQSPVTPYLNMRGIELSGRTLGIIGFGAIGKRLANMAVALGMNVTAHDPYVGKLGDIELFSLSDLLINSDFIAITLPLTAETEGLLGEREIALMKPRAYLVNTTNASIVNERAVVNALQTKSIAGAAFDVFESHLVSPDSPLLKFDNVILTPHIGGATEETIARHSKMMTDDILRFLKGERPVNLVNSEVWGNRG